MRATKILIVGDEPNILRTLRRNLIERGYEVYVAFDDEEADTLNDQLNPDLFVLNLDFTLLDVDGLKICEKLRQVSQSPMIVLSSIGSETIKVRALDLGADDYLVMPFSMEEFLARVRVALRRWLRYKAGPEKEEKIILVRDLLINLDSREVTLRGDRIHLTPTEYDLLIYLAQKTGKVMTHRELLKGVWGDVYGDEREYVRVFVSQLRRKIEDDPVRPEYILTEPGVGYRFAAD
jgi:two-component system KDP operon response regulator KdpE